MPLKNNAPQNKSIFDNKNEIVCSSISTDKMPFSHHIYTSVEISVIKSGSGTLCVNETLCDFKPGDVFLFSCDEYHYIKDFIGCKSAELIIVRFEPECIWSNELGLNNTNLLKAFFEKPPQFENRITRENPISKKIGKLLYEMADESAQKQNEYSLALKIKLIEILILLKRNFDFDCQNCAELLKNENLVFLKKSIDYINDNLTKNLTLDSLAEAASMSRSRFCTIFKKYNGISPWDYITVKRIEMSLHLIANYHMTKFEIASECGFNNTSNFYRAFKKVTGNNPANYF